MSDALSDVLDLGRKPAPRRANGPGLLLLELRLTELPAEIGRLTELRELDLRGNQLTTLPAEIGQLTNLQSTSDLLQPPYAADPGHLWRGSATDVHP